MMRFFSIGIDCISSVLFVVPVVAILQYAIFRQRNIYQFIAVLLFSFYSIAVFSVVGVPTVGTFEIDLGFNFIPVIDIVNSPLEYIKNTVLNIILFIPLGFLVPAIWKDYRSAKTMFFMGLAVSIGIEILQIFTYRLTDIDDLITNTAGTMIGYYISKKLSFKLPLRISDHPQKSTRYEPILIIAAMLLIGTILQPLVSNSLWDIVLSSSWWEKIK